MSFYNEIKKCEYLSVIRESDISSYMSLFNKSSKHESKLGKDLSLFDSKEILEFLDEFKTDTAIKSAISRERKYVEWSRSKKYEICDAILESSANEILDSFGDTKDRKYISEEQYKKYCDIITEEAGGIYFTSMFMSMYEGIAGQGYSIVSNLRITDIGDGFISFGGRIKITKELENMLREVNSTYYLKLSDRHIPLLYCNGNRIWRETKPAKNHRRKFISSYINRIKPALKDPDLNPNDVIRSGRFNRVKQRAKELGLDLKRDLELENVVFDPDNPYLTLNDKYRQVMSDCNIPLLFSRFRIQYKSWSKYV